MAPHGSARPSPLSSATTGWPQAAAPGRREAALRRPPLACYVAGMCHPRGGDPVVSPSEILRVQKYLRDKFGADAINLKSRGQKDGSVEVSIGDEFIGVIFRDVEDGEVSYAFHMAIMEMDLPVAAPVPSR
jgi:hypothetical protein